MVSYRRLTQVQTTALQGLVEAVNIPYKLTVKGFQTFKGSESSTTDCLREPKPLRSEDASFLSESYCQ